MMKRFFLLMLCLSITFSQLNLLASDEGRFATPQEMIGVWKMIPIANADKIDKVNPYPLPYQWFKFNKNGAVEWLMKTDDSSYSVKELDEIFRIGKGTAAKYSWRDGFMVISYPGHEEKWGVNIFQKTVPTPGVKILKGDILMTLAGGRDRAIVYHRLLRRVAK